MKTELISISKIKSNPSNPRTIKDEKFKQLVQSIKDLPQMLEIRPIVVNDDMVVLGGNMRLKACKEAGLKEVYIIRASDLTEDQQREFIIKDNVGFGDWDITMLAKDWNEAELQKWGLDIKLPETTEIGADMEDEYDIPDTIKTDIKEGDFFEFIQGSLRHCLLCGSSTDPKTTEKLLE